MGKYYCSMTNCHNYTSKIGKFGTPVTLHKLPKHVATRRAWIMAISRKNWKPTAYTRVCSDHFNNGIGPNSLDRNKIPKENLAQSTPKRQPKERSKRLYKTASFSDSHSSSTLPPSTSRIASINNFHSYSMKTDEITTEVKSNLSSVSSNPHIGIQTTPETVDASINTSRPDITIEDIMESDDKIQFYSGLPNYVTFHALFCTLLEFDDNSIICDLGRKRKLRPVDEFLLVMMRLRLGLLIKDLEFRFKISSSTVSNIFNSWIVFMSKYLKSIVLFPKLDILQKHVPQCFHSFSDTRIILDCTEIFIQTPSSLENQSLTYSNYKSHNTFKVLVGVSMTGAVVFMSKLWGGSASDVEITRQSGLLDILDSGDAVMVDKGFIHLKPDLGKKGVKLYCPPFKTKEQFSKEEVDLTRRIASARIHVERKMEQIKNFRILQGVMPLAINKQADEIFFVCGALTNLLPPLIN